MITLVRRELQVIGRERAYRIAIVAHVLVTTAFLLAWSPGPVRAFRLIVLALLLPWTAARVVSPRAARSVAARALAAWVSLALVVFAAFPVVVFADRIDGLNWLSAVRAELPAQLLAVAVAALLIAWRRLTGDRLVGWIGATVSTAALVALQLTIGGQL